MNGPRLTPEEQAHTLAALCFLRIRVGTWRALAKVLGFEMSTLKNVRKGVNDVSINMAYKVAKLASVTFDDVTSGRYPVPGMCPHCGRGPSAINGA